jgi:membrane-bound lytic murein transglycosylase A
MSAGWRQGLSLATIALLAGCGRLVPPGYQPPPVAQRPPAMAPGSATRPIPTPLPKPIANALTAGVSNGPPVAGLGLTQAKAAGALASFLDSCPKLAIRTDTSGLTQPADWAAPCAAAATWAQSDAAGFFTAWFDTAIVGAGSTFVTGYYEPEIAGSRVHEPGFDVPIYSLPPDLVRQAPVNPQPGDPPPVPVISTGKQPIGRYDASGQFVPYYSRAEIEDGALAGRGLEIAWAADPAEFFFLQVQGSGRLRAPDGSVMRIGYAGQNGLPYSGIGSILKAQGLLGDGPGQYQSSMQGIVKYIHEHPDEGRALMRQDASYVFFRELTGADTTTGPIGALNVPVRPRVSLAADPAYVPLGAPVWLTTDRAPTNGLWVAQDTGGAIKGANRFDSFWGAGAEARLIAGGMDARGTALVLLPKGVLVRLTAR